jgi:hypothetical protein
VQLSSPFFQRHAFFPCWKENLALILPRCVATSENDRLHIYSLWYYSCKWQFPTPDIFPAVKQWFMLA